LALIKSYQALNIEIYKPNLRAAMEKDLSRICKGELEAEDLFNKMRIESKKLFETVQDNINVLQNNLENYLADDIKNDEYIKLSEISESNINENDIPKANNNESAQKKTNSNSEKYANKNNFSINEKINFAKELEENEKLKRKTDEIINSIRGNKSKENLNSSKLKFENSLRGMLNISKKKKESDSSETDDNSNGKPINNDHESDYSQKKEFLVLDNKCPSCKTANIKLLKNKNTLTYFVGCSAFPKCSFIKSINNPSKVKISNDFCETCKGNNRKTLLFELEFHNLKNKNGENTTKDECFVCLLENDPKINNANAYYKTNNYQDENRKPYYQKNNNSNYKNNFYKKNFKSQTQNEE
jgi:hypothetical protein